MTTYEKLKKLFEEKYSADSLQRVTFPQFKEDLDNRIQSERKNIQFNFDESKQRDLSIKFCWGHHHDFGRDYKLEGRMKDRHLRLVSEFVDTYGLPMNLKGKKILDIGVWTGGTPLLLVAMGAQVHALEEVSMYAETVNYLAYAYGIDHQLKCFAKSLYDFLPPCIHQFDYILYPGVLYHVSDPLLSLRLVFTALKDNGSVYLETCGIDSQESICKYEGPSYIRRGNKEEQNRGGWNYFFPSGPCIDTWCRDAGFQETQIGPCIKFRIMGAAKRLKFQDFCRAGISKTNCR